MVFIPVVDRDGNSRKSLGPKTNKVTENKLDKLLLYDSRHASGGFNIKQVEPLFNLDFATLSPSDFLKIFGVLRRNLYYDEGLYLALYRALANKVSYFTPDELVNLLESLSPFSVVKHSSGYSGAFLNQPDTPEGEPQSDLCELSSLAGRMGDIYEVQNEVLAKLIDVLELKLKFNDTSSDHHPFYFKSKCLETLNKFSFLNRWSLLIELSDDLTNHLLGTLYQSSFQENTGQISIDQTLKSLNTVSDAISLKSMHLMCRNIEDNRYRLSAHNTADFVNLSLVEHRDIVFSYYARGDLQILSLVENYYRSLRLSLREQVTAQLVEELISISKILKKLNSVSSFLRQNASDLRKPGNIDSFLSFNFKMWNLVKFMSQVDQELFLNENCMEEVWNELSKFTPEFFVENSELISPKNQALLVSLLSESASVQSRDRLEPSEISSFSVDNREDLSVPKFKSEGNSRTADCGNTYTSTSIFQAVRSITGKIANLTDLSSIDRLNVLESCYNSFGYVNHFTAKKFLDHILNQFPKNPLDSVVMFRALFFSFKLPFNLVWPERKNIRKSFDFLAGSKLTGCAPSFKSVEFHLNRSALRARDQAACQFDNLAPLKWDLSRVKMYTSSILGQKLTRSLMQFKFRKI